jgi:hypothetical protein
MMSWQNEQFFLADISWKPPSSAGPGSSCSTRKRLKLRCWHLEQRILPVSSCASEFSIDQYVLADQAGLLKVVENPGVAEQIVLVDSSMPTCKQDIRETCREEDLELIRKCW